MTRITGNKAAWLPFEKAKASEVGPGPQPDPAENEVVIKVAYAAVNPTDWKMQDTPYLQFPYPWIFGVDVAGTVVQLGSNVTRFKVGQRVIGHCDGLLTRKPTNSAFQLYSTCLEILVVEVPDAIPLANAAVLPLATSTAACGIYKHLKLPYPTLDPKPTGRTILIWGGSSSVGSSAIQLAVGSGYTVATTASAHNEIYVKELGATYFFDHQDFHVVENILKTLKPGDVVFDAISTPSSQKALAEIVNRLGGGIIPVVGMPEPTGFENVETAFVNGLDPGLVNLEIGDAVWRKYLPQALAARKFQAKPDPIIVEGGLEKVQEGIDILRKGVSAKKVVIEIEKHA